MTTEQRELPLFPLNAVLFPDTSIPLHVFEERYKLMMSQVLEGDRLFGVVLIRKGAEVGEPAIPYAVGTTARVVDVNRMDDGRMYLSAVGLRRFRIQEILEQEPYLRAQVEVLEDEHALMVAPELLQEAKTLFEEYVRSLMGIQGGWIRGLALAAEPLSLSYLIASALRGDPPLRQQLLEAPTPSERLQQEMVLLRRETERVKRKLWRSGPLGKLSRN
ncbi:MAG: LON peptidase substrate-binding domain-containing protein [Chloroflexi bacterium]|nr:LON peptidase substrate-binding domain-containing protein [Chloroflexota bacterium]